MENFLLVIMRKKLRFSLLLIIFLFIGCGEKIYRPNNFLIDWLYDIEGKESYPSSPYVVVYRDGRKELRFLADSHGTEKEGFFLALEEFKKHAPQVLIVEGVRYKDGFSPARVIDTIDNQLLCSKSEGPYSINLALRYKIPFIGAEPPDIDLLNVTLSTGYSIKDYHGYEIIRQMDTVREVGKVRTGEFSFVDYKDRFKDKFSIKNESLLLKNEKEFLDWYKKNYGTSYDKSAKYWENDFDKKLSVQLSKTRSRHIVKVIADMLNRYDKVLVVYGASHAIELARVLEDMLGKPTFEVFGVNTLFIPVEETQTIRKKCDETGCQYGTVRQSFKHALDFHIEKKSNSYYVRHYRIMRVFRKEHFLKQYQFKTLEEVNKHLKFYF